MDDASPTSPTDFKISCVGCVMNRKRAHVNRTVVTGDSSNRNRSGPRGRVRPAAADDPLWPS